MFLSNNCLKNTSLGHLNCYPLPLWLICPAPLVKASSSPLRHKLVLRSILFSNKNQYQMFVPQRLPALLLILLTVIVFPSGATSSSAFTPQESKNPCPASNTRTRSKGGQQWLQSQLSLSAPLTDPPKASPLKATPRRERRRKKTSNKRTLQQQQRVRVLRPGQTRATYAQGLRKKCFVFLSFFKGDLTILDLVLLLVQSLVQVKLEMRSHSWRQFA